MSSAPNSLSRAFEAEHSASILGAESSPEQLDLLRRDDGRLPDNVFQMARAEKRKPGRPKDSINRKSSDLAKLLGAKFPDPVQFQASVYAMPLDQLCEALLVADGSMARQRQVDELMGQLSDRVAGLVKLAGLTGTTSESIERLADACEALENAARRSQGKPGDVALKALNLQLAAARTVAEYIHSKKPVEAVLRHQADLVMVMPPVGGAGAGGFAALDAGTRAASDVIAQALASGQITGDMLLGLKLVDGQLIDGDFSAADNPDGEE